MQSSIGPSGAVLFVVDDLYQRNFQVTRAHACRLYIQIVKSIVRSISSSRIYHSYKSACKNTRLHQHLPIQL